MGVAEQGGEDGANPDPEHCGGPGGSLGGQHG